MSAFIDWLTNPKNYQRLTNPISESVSKNTLLTQAVSSHDEESRLSAADGDNNDGDDSEGDYSDDDYDDNTQGKTALERRPTVDKGLRMEEESGIKPMSKRSGDDLSKSSEELQEQHEELKSVVNKSLRRRERARRENRLAEKLLENEAGHQKILDDRARELEDLHKRRIQELVVEKAEVKQEKEETAEFRQEKAEFKQEKQASQAGETSVPSRGNKRPKQERQTSQTEHDNL
ncbi:hypothetical protein BGX21_000707, partial [Mortierella sp. AD011]